MRCRSILATLTVLLFVTATAAAQPQIEVKKIDGRLEYYLTNHGLYGYNVADSAPGFSYPKGSAAISYLNGGGLWFAAQKRSGDSMRKLAFVTFDPATHRSWAAPGGWSTSPAPAEDSSLNRIYNSQEYHSTTGQYIGTEGPAPAWPLWDRYSYGTPAVPGRFISDTAQRNRDSSGEPAFAYGSIQLVSRYHDGVTDLYDESEPGHPIGLQIQQNVYSQMQFDNFVIVQYRVVNVSGDTLRDCYVGSILDPLIGAVAENDHVGYLPMRDIGYAWSDTESPNNPGILGLYLLEGPFVHYDDRNSIFRFVANRHGTYNDTMIFTELRVHSFRSWSSDLELDGSQQRYDYMASGKVDNDPAASDRTMLMTAGPFHMRPNDAVEFAVAVAVLPELNPDSPLLNSALAESRSAVELLYQFGYIDDVENSGASTAGRSMMRIHPNPTATTTTLSLHLPFRDSPIIQLVDPLGRVVFERRTGLLDAGDHVVNLDLDDIAAGLYLVTLESNGVRQSQTLVVSR